MAKNSSEGPEKLPPEKEVFCQAGSRREVLLAWIRL
jgi:hypothetical protein